MATFGEALRTAREARGWSREQLRRAILRQFDEAPTVCAIRSLERGFRKAPQAHNLVKFYAALPYVKVLVSRSDTK